MTTTNLSPVRRRVLTRVAFGAALLAVAVLPFTLSAQAPAVAKAPASWADQILSQEGYATPPKELTDAVLAPRYLNVNLSNLSPDKKWYLNEIGDGQVVMKTFSKPFDELGGVFIDFKANRDRNLTIRNNIGIQLISATDGTKKPLAIPAGARVSGARWSPDGSAIFYLVHGEDATNIWMTNVAAGQPQKVTTTPLLATFATTFEMSADGKQIAAVIIPDGRSPRPVDTAAVPTGPEVKISEGKKASLRTFPSLMTTPHQWDLLEWHARGQVAIIDVATKAIKKVGEPRMVRSIDLSPNGQYLRVTTLEKPFSYIVPVASFGSKEEVWDATGKKLAELSSRPINLGAVPDDPNADPNAAPQAGGGGRGRGGNQGGKRELAWASDGQGFTYLEQEPLPPGSAPAGGGGARAGRGGGRGAGGAGAAAGGGAQQGPPRPDRLMRWLPPFDTTSTKLIYQNSTLMAGARFSQDMSMLFYSETAGQATTEYAIYLNEPATRYPLMKTAAGAGGRGAGGAAAAGGGAAAAGAADDVNTGGTLVGVRGAGGGGRAGGGGGARGGGGGGGPVLLSGDKSAVFYEGTTYDKNPEQVGPKSFLNKVTIKTGVVEPIFESDNKDVYERLGSIIDPDTKTFVVMRESPKDTPQDFLVTGTTRKQLTDNKDIAPDLTAAPKLKIPITRADGFHFTIRVTLPVGYQQGTRLPALFWVYPSEYETQEAHDRTDRTFNKNTFENFGTRSMEFLIRQGYAVIEDAPDHLPIVGPAGKQNDNYVDDLRADLLACIDELDKRGIIDRQKLAIGGHSYGAFTTVNAMVHTTFFKAGIAGDGNYNRTLTPFGFQNERRTLWDAPNVYFDMSPLFYANHLSGALLMYHNLHDQNVGTDPINSERLFEALNEQGKTAAMYRYPYEDHGPVAKETLLDMWARWSAWLDKYVKNPQPAVVTKPAPSRGGGRY